MNLPGNPISLVRSTALGLRPQYNKTGPVQTSQTPLETLKARYAGREITRAEYEQMHQDLGG